MAIKNNVCNQNKVITGATDEINYQEIMNVIKWAKPKTI